MKNSNKNDAHYDTYRWRGADVSMGWVYTKLIHQALNYLLKQ